MKQKAISLILGMFLCSTVFAGMLKKPLDTFSTKVVGIVTDYSAVLVQGFRVAVENQNGVYVDSETIVENSTMKSDIIKNLSYGTIYYSNISPKKDLVFNKSDGVYVVPFSFNKKSSGDTTAESVTCASKTDVKNFVMQEDLIVCKGNVFNNGYYGLRNVAEVLSVQDAQKLFNEIAVKYKDKTKTK